MLAILYFFVTLVLLVRAFLLENGNLMMSQIIEIIFWPGIIILGLYRWLRED